MWESQTNIWKHNFRYLNPEKLGNKNEVKD